MTRLTRAEKSLYGYDRAVSVPKEEEEEDFMTMAHNKREREMGD